jgi:LacI family transcriptional regulator
LAGTIRSAKKSTATKPARPKSRNGNVTIIDIARMANVSKSTVSLVLQESALVKDETRKLVLEAIDRLGYVYNRAAAGLRQAKADFIGIVIGDLANPFFPELAAGIEDVLLEHQMLPVLANTSEDPEKQSQVIRTLREHGVAGIILCPARGTSAWAIAESVPKGLPVVVTMCSIEDCPFPFVGPDNVKGSYQATQHLLDLGHRDIAFIGGDNSYGTHRERVRGWRQAMQNTGIAIDERLVIDAATTREGGAEAIEKTLALRPKATAAVCYNDVVALGASSYLAEVGVIVGKDFSLVGFDDISEASHSQPPLTTIDAGIRLMAKDAALRLLQMINKQDYEKAPLRGDTKLIIRESTSRLQTKGLIT